MRNRFVLSSATNALMVLLCTCTAWAQTTTTKATPRAAAVSAHRVAIQVNDNDPKVMNLALNNAKNVARLLQEQAAGGDDRNRDIRAGFAHAAGDTSPVKQRVAEMSLACQEITFAACANTQANMAKQEAKDIHW